MRLNLPRVLSRKRRMNDDAANHLIHIHALIHRLVEHKRAPPRLAERNRQPQILKPLPGRHSHARSRPLAGSRLTRRRHHGRGALRDVLGLAAHKRPALLALLPRLRALALVILRRELHLRAHGIMYELRRFILLGEPVRLDESHIQKRHTLCLTLAAHHARLALGQILWISLRLREQNVAKRLRQSHEVRARHLHVVPKLRRLLDGLSRNAESIVQELLIILNMPRLVKRNDSLTGDKNALHLAFAVSVSTL